MKKATNLWAVVAILFVAALLASPGYAWMADRDDVEHTGKHVFNEQGSVDLRGTWKIDGTEVTATAAQLNGVRTALEINGDLTLANDETIDNATDAKVRVTFDDDAAVLGEFILESDNAVANVADNDSVGIVFKAYDSATAKTEYASIDLRADDVTDSTEDGGVLIKTFIGGTERTVATLGAANTVGAAQATLALTSSDWAIDATGAATGLGAVAADGDVDLSATGGSASDPDFGVAGYARFAGTINETNITRVVSGVTCVTTNQAFLSATGVTNTLVIVDGIITAIN